MNDATKTVTLTFKRTELLYDIKNYAYVEGDVMKTDDSHARHQVMDIGEDGNVDRVTRMLDLAFAQCVEACYPFSKEEVEDDTSLDDVLTEQEEYVMRLHVPEDFSRTTVELLRRLIHELLVYRVLQDWMSITNPDSKTSWQEKIDSIEGQVSSALSARIRPVRRPLRPF